jgi:formylglycine-generating enzyme required for sulfatase activity
MCKRILFIFILGVISLQVVKANNVNVSNVVLTGQNVNFDYTLVQFNISWDNSWRTSTLESNWDAAWVFVKWRKKSSLIWNHATLDILAQTAPAGSTIKHSLDGKGAFIYKAVDGIGANNWIGVQLQWNYGVDGLLDGELVEVAVFAIEMVYVPSGAFYLGDGSSNTIEGHFEAGTTGVPFLVTSENAITLGGGGAGSLGNNNAVAMVNPDDFNDATTQLLPAAYPKGVTAFYIMKYEITQEQYAEFLNKLTLAQQTLRTVSSPFSVAGTGALLNPNNDPNLNRRNGIDIQVPALIPITPAVYACNVNGNTSYNEVADGQNIACNFLSWPDMAAYLDWSGLRPFTEFEYEKACRGGNLAAVVDEFAWGNTSATNATALTNSGSPNEVATNAGANCHNSFPAFPIDGPMRVGNFAQVATDRQNSGGTYYGAMEMSGNIYEPAITVGNTTGRIFNGINGDGNLDTSGNSNVSNWPATNFGLGMRGGYWYESRMWLRVSDRYWGGTLSNSRGSGLGGRGAHIAP